MLISYERQFLFFHVPKTGGSSVRSALVPFAHDASQYRTNQFLDLLGIRVNHVAFDYRKRRFRTHERATVVGRHLPQSIFDSLFKFAFVRNPWELLVSQYKYIRQQKAHRRHKQVMPMSFGSFVEYAHRKKLCTQSERLLSPQRKLAVDFVGRFESLACDFEIIRRELKLPTSVRLPHTNRTRPDQYQDYYSPLLRERVRNLWRDDIERFEYSFDRIQTGTVRAA